VPHVKSCCGALTLSTVAFASYGVHGQSQGGMSLQADASIAHSSCSRRRSNSRIICTFSPCTLCMSSQQPSQHCCHTPCTGRHHCVAVPRHPEYLSYVLQKQIHTQQRHTQQSHDMLKVLLLCWEDQTSSHTY
jgi:hypothetical protein